MSRREDLKEWKRSRRAEIAMDVISSVVLARNDVEVVRLSLAADDYQ